LTTKVPRELWLAGALGLLFGILAWARPDFFAVPNLRDLLVTKAYVLVAAVGMTLVILARQIDISIGSQFAISGVLASLLARAGAPLPVVALGTLLGGSVLGAVNGALVAVLGIPAIVATLSTMVIAQQGVRWATGGEPVHHPPGFQWLGLGLGAGRALIVLLSLGVFLGFAAGLRGLAAGRSIYATGSDPEAARLAGLRPRRVVFGVFVTMGIMTALGALLNVIQGVEADPTSGEGLGLEVIAAVVVGGTAISGGRGTLWGTLLGVALLGVIGPALVFLKVEASWERAVQGAIILVAVASDAFNLRQRAQGGRNLVAP
jgi:rhamnose transport system permease protein